MRRFILPILVLATCAPVLARQQSIREQADAAYERSDFAECSRLYTVAGEAEAGDAGLPYMAACCFARDGKKDEAFKALDLAFARYFPREDLYETDESFASLRSDPRWQAFLARVHDRAARVDRALRTELLAMRDADQALIKQQHADDDPAWTAKFADLNGKQVARLREIVKQKGWPGRNLVGSDGASAAWLIVQHADIAVQREFLPILRAAVRAAELSPIEVAYLEDRILVHDGEKQVYGTQGKFLDDGSIVPQPIEDEAHVDERRKAIGLGPIAEYYRQMQEVFKDRRKKP